MKSYSRWYFLGVIFLVITACNPIGQLFTKPVVDSIFIPITEPSLFNLQVGLIVSKKLNGNWPASVPELLQVNNDEKINLDISKFDTLHWIAAGDSLFVNYKISYPPEDSSRYRFLAGKFYLIYADTVKFSHIKFRGELKSGALKLR